MATLKQLYDLVHSLDKGEKKNLSIMIDAMGGKGRERYANAIRIINAQTGFDAARLKQKLSADVKGMYLAEANDYVFTFVCKFLVGHHAPATGNLGFLKEMILIEIFVSKGLFELAARYLEPLLVKVKKGNSFGILARALELQTIIVASDATTTRDHKKRIGILKQRTQVARDHLQYLEVVELYQQTVELVDSFGEPRDKKQLAAYSKVYSHPVFNLSYSDISQQAFTIYAPMRADMLNLMKGKETAIEDSIAAYAEFHKRFDVSNNYISAFYLLDSILTDCLLARKDRELIKWKAELQKLLPYATHHTIKQQMYAKIMQAELGIEIIQKNFERGVKKLDEWMKPEKKALWEEAPLAYMNYMFGARLHYMNGSPQRALDFLYMQKDKQSDFRPASLIAYRFLHLLCYYQMGSTSLLYSTATSIYKSLLKEEKLYAPERAILKFAKASGKVEKIQRNIKELHASLKELSTDPLHSSFFHFADYVEWLEMEFRKKL